MKVETNFKNVETQEEKSKPIGKTSLTYILKIYAKDMVQWQDIKLKDC